jgi:hypothetical protein
MHRTTRAAAFLAGLTIVSTTPAVFAADPFTLIVVPDSQNYTDFADINTTYNVGQMRWIRDNMTNMNIKFVMHLGDHQNPGNPYRASTTDIYEPDLSRPIGDAADKTTKWNRADAAINVLDNNNIPYSLVPGNHDYQDHDTKAEPWLYLKTFGPQRYVDEQSTWAPENRTYGGASPANPNNGYAGMDTYHRFDAGGYKFLNIALQFDPDNADLKWAQQIINENPGLPTIITTHAYVNTKPAASDYQHPDIFNKLVKNNPQIVMTFNGHLTGANYVAGENIAGQTVHQMLVDFQASQLDAQLGANYYRGGGTLRMVQIDPSVSRVTVKDYSTVADKFLPNNFTAPDNDGDIATYSTPTGFNIDWAGRFGLPDKAGITKSISFRQGVSGYSGTRDTYVDASAPDTNFGTAAIGWVDGDRVSGGAEQAAQSLIRFDAIFDPGNIPAGAQIESAQLVLHTDSATDSQTGNTISLYRLLDGWQEGAATWNSKGNGLSLDGDEAILAANDAVTPTVRDGFVTFDVTESIAAFAAGAPINGGVIDDTSGNDGWRWDTSEAADLLDRPQLNVTYRIVPEPGSMGVACVMATIAALRRRRRA